MPPVMENCTPHKQGCPATEEPVQLGLAYFCPQCNRRLGFLPQAAAEEKIVEGIANFFS